MNESQDETSHRESLLESWMRTSAEFWTGAFSKWAKSIDASMQASSPPQSPRVRGQETWEAGIQALQVVASAMKQPEAAEGIFKGIGGIPYVMAKLVKPVWEAFFHLQQEWVERAGRIGKSTAAYNFGNLDQEVFSGWLEIYDKEFRQFLQIPQLGLARSYQERINDTLDKFNILQATMAEFFSILCLPMERSLKVLQDKLSEMEDSGKLPEKSQDYYRIWIKILEGHYMSLFKSSDYNQVMACALDALCQYITARSRIMEDALQFLPLPSHKDLDECYKDIYLLKKRVKALEKQCAGEART
jgi:class III poly(R)-hydroxyalkanoic acid synthase PhaE subunit